MEWGEGADARLEWRPQARAVSTRQPPPFPTGPTLGKGKCGAAAGDPAKVGAGQAGLCTAYLVGDPSPIRSPPPARREASREALGGQGGLHPATACWGAVARRGWDGGGLPTGVGSGEVKLRGQFRPGRVWL